MTTERRKLVVPVLAAAAIVLAIPYTTRTAPEWRVQLLDQQRRPLAGFPVSESWQYSTFESELHWETRGTDGNGWVTFPPRYVRANLAQRAYGAVLNARSFVHATWGPFVYVSASPEGFIADAYGWAVRDWLARLGRIAITGRTGRTPLCCALSRLSNSRLIRIAVALTFHNATPSISKSMRQLILWWLLPQILWGDSQRIT